LKVGAILKLRRLEINDFVEGKDLSVDVEFVTVVVVVVVVF
jgi:hypothetical protein